MPEHDLHGCGGPPRAHGRGSQRGDDDERDDEEHESRALHDRSPFTGTSGARNASGSESPCAARRSSTSASISSSVRVAAVFGSSIAAWYTCSGSPSSAARTANSQRSEEHTS